MTVNSQNRRAQITAVVGAYLGDEGKGKVTDTLLGIENPQYEIAGRFGGGYGTGHAIIIDGVEYVFKGGSVALLRPDTQTVIGRGCLFEPTYFKQELDMVRSLGVDFLPPIISNRAAVTTDYDRIIETIWESESGKIGSTRTGVGPTYSDVPQKVAIKVSYLEKPTLLRERLDVAARRYEPYFRVYENFLAGRGIEIPSSEIVAERLEAAFQRLHDKVRVIDESSFLRTRLEKGERIICEGTQSGLLNPDFGMYPYTSAAPSTSGGVFNGLGIPPQPIQTILVAKAFVSNVGYKPFPTEITDEALAQTLRNNKGDLGAEFGKSSGRQRQVGWPDAVMAKYSSQINGANSFVITKVDQLDTLDTIPVCTEYIDIRTGNVVASVRDRHIEFPETFDMMHVRPHYGIDLPGWRKSTKGIRRREDLPREVMGMMDFYQELFGIPPSFLTNGYERDAFVMM